ncbi:hypothetical protein CBM2623_U10018 [Cupriavidus taiwanensis]|nr:hypothetical protein CBM2608_U20015 [Cupriavidus taiwanensis]SPA38231.1 hypothetical protein CBM2623_U10018 [Cupriavidus taiwanensis]
MLHERIRLSRVQAKLRPEGYGGIPDTLPARGWSVLPPTQCSLPAGEGGILAALRHTPKAYP